MCGLAVLKLPESTWRFVHVVDIPAHDLHAINGSCVSQARQCLGFIADCFDRGSGLTGVTPGVVDSSWSS